MIIIHLYIYIKTIFILRAFIITATLPSKPPNVILVENKPRILQSIKSYLCACSKACVLSMNGYRSCTSNYMKIRDRVVVINRRDAMQIRPIRNVAWGPCLVQHVSAAKGIR
jgi:hypothetical protein